MKTIYKISTLTLFMLLCGMMQAQILNYDFENLNVGDRVAATIGDPWTTWNNAPGTDQDAQISNEHSEGARSLKIDNGNDVVLKLGDKTTGAYKISFDMYIPEGKEGYYNLLHEFDQTSPTNSNRWAYEIFFNSAEHDGTYINPASYYWESELHPFEVPYDEWFTVDTYANLDDGLITVNVNGRLLCYIQYTTLSLAAMDLFPSNNTDPDKNGFYIDNITFDYWNETFVHNVVTHGESINYYIASGDIDTIAFGIENAGNSVGRFTSWVDYGVGGESGETRTMNYDTDPWYNYGNYDDAPYIEIGVRFWSGNINYYGCMGTKVTKMEYFLPFSYPTTEVGCVGPMTFRIYNYQTSEILAEKVLDTYYAGQWNVAEFDEPIPLTGFGVMATVGFQQIEQGYPISLDQGPSLKNQGDLIRLNGGSWFSLNTNARYYGQQDWGNHNIRLICEGEPVNGTWVANNVNFVGGIILPGHSKWMKIQFDATDLEYGVYTATLKIVTNDDENPELSIPIMMKVTPENIEDNVSLEYNLYPNPASDILNIEGEELSCAIIYNSTGEMVNIVQITNNSINISSLTPGLYYLNIINNKGESAIQIIMKN